MKTTLKQSRSKLQWGRWVFGSEYKFWDSLKVPLAKYKYRYNTHKFTGSSPQQVNTSSSVRKNKLLERVFIFLLIKGFCFFFFKAFRQKASLSLPLFENKKSLPAPGGLECVFVRIGLSLRELEANVIVIVFVFVRNRPHVLLSSISVCQAMLCKSEESFYARYLKGQFAK